MVSCLTPFTVKEQFSFTDRSHPPPSVSDDVNNSNSDVEDSSYESIFHQSIFQALTDDQKSITIIDNHVDDNDDFIDDLDAEKSVSKSEPRTKSTTIIVTLNDEESILKSDDGDDDDDRSYSTTDNLEKSLSVSVSSSEASTASTITTVATTTSTNIIISNIDDKMTSDTDIDEDGSAISNNDYGDNVTSQEKALIISNGNASNSQSDTSATPDESDLEKEYFIVEESTMENETKNTTDFKTGNISKDCGDKPGGNEYITENDIVITSSPKGQRSSRRERHKKSTQNKKWKQIDVHHFGFHMSAITRLPDEPTSSNTSTSTTTTDPTDDSNACSTGTTASTTATGSASSTSTTSTSTNATAYHVEQASPIDKSASNNGSLEFECSTPSSNCEKADELSVPSKHNSINATSIENSNEHEKMTKGCDDNDNENDNDDNNKDDISIICDDNDSDLDDKQFFINLGIDVSSCGDNDTDDNDILQWDGVRFNTKLIKNSLKTNIPKPSTKATPSRDNKSKTGKQTSSKQSGDLNINNKTTNTKNSYNNNRYMANMSKRNIDILFDVECSPSNKIYIRPDKHRRVMKAHKAVKSKHACISDVFINPSKKQLYMHHRLIKRHSIDINFIHHYSQRSSSNLPKPITKTLDKEWIRGIRVRTRKSTGVRPTAQKPENLRHVLHETNVPQDYETDLVSFLFSIQNRELTPEDYEMLLRLDDSVQAKTVSKSVLDSLKRETVGEVIPSDDEMCTICMEPYVANQVRTFLPCQHDFHNDCIETWLKNNSQNCPLDGLPIELS